MLIRKGMIAFLFLAVVPIGVWAIAEPSERTMLSIQVYDKSDASKVLLDRKVMVPKNGKIKLIDGGEWPAEHPDDRRQFGTQINGFLRENDKRLSLRIDVSSKLSSDVLNSKVISGEYIDLQTTVVPGVKTKLHCGGERWCEITLTKSLD